ncbi:MAG: type VI secretion lipoprotein TssJ [Candidatus Latescibacteria bacterium]|nr:type VI secretion lipoprotein TssJ [Candidatus Latescibacterota bacterium]
MEQGFDVSAITTLVPCLPVPHVKAVMICAEKHMEARRMSLGRTVVHQARYSGTELQGSLFYLTFPLYPAINIMTQGKRDYLKKIVSSFSLLIIFIFSVGLTPRQPNPTPVWSFESGAVSIEYNSDKSLNFFNDKPHTMIMVVYQMKATDAFDTMSITEEGLKKLLQADRFDPSVVSIDKMIIQPDEKKTRVFDRFENAKWVGIVAGYYELIPGHVSNTYKIPVIYGKKGRIRKRKTVDIGSLLIKVNLGPKTILKADSEKPDSTKADTTYESK